MERDLTPLTVGVPCRDEGQDFPLFARGLRNALSSLPAEVPIEVLVCVNGSSEDFGRRLPSQMEACGLGGYNVRFITSAEGKLEAMKAVALNRTYQGYLAFVDSDVVLAPNVLRRLWEVLESDSTCQVTYGQPVPVFPRRQNLIHRLCRVHYVLRDRTYHRPYFHGRAFMLRQWFLDEPASIRDISPVLVRRLKLQKGPLVDDVAMSLMAVARWGTRAIREVREANVYFDPPDDIRGLYAGSLRVALEIRRLGFLYPQHCQLLESTLTKSWRKSGLARFSWNVRALHAVHRALDLAIGVAAQLHVRLIRYGILKVDTLWIRVQGTKSFARHLQMWRDFNEASATPPRKS